MFHLRFLFIADELHTGWAPEVLSVILHPKALSVILRPKATAALPQPYQKVNQYPTHPNVSL